MSLNAEIAADTRYALRGFKRTPGLTIITVATLALGLGATAAIFSVVNAVLLRPLPFAEPERLVQIVEHVPAAEGFAGVAQRRSVMNTAELDWWRTNSQTLSEVAVMLGGDGRTLSTADGSVQLYGQRVSPALFAMRGVPPLLGRGLLADDERPDNDVIVLSEAMWREHFSADPEIVGRRIELNSQTLTVVGVMPPAFGDEAFWTPFVAAPAGSGVMFGPAQARLAEGVSLETASAEANTLGLQLRGIAPEPGAPPRFEVVRTLDEMTAAVAPALRVLVGAVGVLLALVCTNVANLLLVRGTRRQQEIAIRRSIGATRGRIIRQVLTESLVLAGFAALAAVVFAFAGVGLLKATGTAYVNRRFAGAPPVLPRLDEISVDPAVLGFVVGLSILTGVLFGLLPAVRLSKYGERGHASQSQLSTLARNSRLGHVLATVQLACAMGLLIGAGLLVNSFLKLTGISPGIDPQGVLSFELIVPGDSTAERKLEVAETLVARLETDSRVRSAGFADIPPLVPGIVLFSANFVPPGMTQADLNEEQRTQAPNERTQTRQVSPGYLRSLGARLVAGTWLDDREGTGPAVLVTRPFAERYFPNGDAVGATMTSGPNVVTIAGVVDDIHLGRLEGEPERAVFLDVRQMLEANRRQGRSPQLDRFFLTVGGSGIPFAARTTGDPLAIMADLRRIVRDIDPSLAIDGAVPMERIVASLTTRPRFYAAVLSTFGVIAGFIAVIGLYGVLSYVVGQRTKEIGVRMALGAQRTSVLRLVLRQGATIVAIGVIAGVAGAAALTRYLEGTLYGLTALDLTTFAVVATAFATVAMFAAYLPARRATAIDPLVALRQD